MLGSVLLALAGWSQANAQGVPDQSEEIVYIDGNGFIRVLDPDQTGGASAVQWRSPVGNWYDAAVGDLNGDGDAEIVALGPGAGNENGDTVRLTLYDPVVASGPVNPEQRINGIPWDTLYTTEFDGDPLDVAVGLFTLNQPQTSIVVGAILPDRGVDGATTPSQIHLLDPASPDARSWTERFERDFSNEWSLIRTGDVDNLGIDEVVLVDEGQSVLAAYRVADGMSDEADRIFVNGSESKKWNDAVVTTQRDENLLAAVRGTPRPLASLIVHRYPGITGVEWEEAYGEWLNPEPLRIFAADINDNGDDELFLLRDVPTNESNPRLFMRNLDDDSLNVFETRLDDDNGYRQGAGGNIYGDDGGKDEIVIIRDNNIRIYLQPEFNQSQVDFGGSTNQRTVLVGDLDAAGFVQRARLAANPSELDERIEQGQSGGPYVIDLINGGSDLAIPFTYEVRGNPSWIEVEASSGETPASFQVYFDAGRLLSGQYRTAIDVSTTYPDIVDSETTIPITLTVESAIVVTPDTLFFDLYPCTDPVETITQALAVTGPIGLSFSARVAPSAGSTQSVPWATVDPTGGSLPDTVTLTLDPERRTADLEEAVLILRESDSGGFEQSVPIVLFCAQDRSYLPLIGNK